MAYYERHLPHWQPTGKGIFLTWRLHGSLPVAVLKKIRESKIDSAAKRFRAFDKHLDSAASGPLWLKDPRVAEMVVQAIHHESDPLRRYDLHAFVVMANHVHLLILPKAPLRKITESLKGFTARQANKILRRRGPFWQDESFDHWVRSENQYRRIRHYIEHNPVTAGLVSKAEQWPWSSATAL
jgi:REP element-mobilizing transposase RayT